MQLRRFEANGAPVVGWLHEPHDRLVAHKTRPALVICAGGGYQRLSPREKDPVLLHFAALGYQCFLLEYSTKEAAAGLRPLRELAETVHILRAHAADWQIEPEHVAVLGFSAGGHLAASLGTLWEHEALALPADCRPDAMVLCYPVITGGEFAHAQSLETVSGGDAAMRELLSLEKRVTPRTPPCFLWHCVGDESVPVENSILFATALQRAGVPYECHLFAGGAHGISMCNQEVETPYPEAAAWLALCDTWLNRQFDYTP